MKPMSGKMIALISTFVSGVSLFFFGLIIGQSARVDRTWEFIICLYFFSFLFVIYFISDIKTIKKAIIYCIVAPLLFCALFSATDIVTKIATEHVKNISKISNIIEIILVFSGLPLYFMGGWIVSISLIIVLCFYLHVQKSNRESLEKMSPLSQSVIQENFAVKRLNKYNKFSFIAGFVYVIFMILYRYFFKNFEWGESGKFTGIIPICLLSLSTILYLVSMVFDNIKKLIICCMLLPAFWCVLVRTIYALFIFVYTYVWGMKHFKENLWSIGFYLDYYAETKAWFISLLLVLICGIYYFFASKQLGRCHD